MRPSRRFSSSATCLLLPRRCSRQARQKDYEDRAGLCQPPRPPPSGFPGPNRGHNRRVRVRRDSEASLTGLLDRREGRDHGRCPAGVGVSRPGFGIRNGPNRGAAEELILVHAKWRTIVLEVINRSLGLALSWGAPECRRAREGVFGSAAGLVCRGCVFRAAQAPRGWRRRGRGRAR